MIDEIKQALAKATPGKWISEETDDGHRIIMATAIESPGRYDSHHAIEYEHGVYEEDGEQFVEAEANTHLIAKATEWLHYLIGEVERYREALSATSPSQDTREQDVCEDCGKPWALGDPTAEVEETRIKLVCENCF